MENLSTQTLTSVSRETALRAQPHTIAFSEKFNRDGSVNLTGYFADDDTARKWKRDFDPPVTKAKAIKPDATPDDLLDS